MPDVGSHSQHGLRSATGALTFPTDHRPLCSYTGNYPRSPQTVRKSTRLLFPLPKPRIWALPGPGIENHHWQEKMGGQVTRLESEWRNESQWREQLYYSHTRMWLLFGKITGKPEIWYPNVSVFIQEDICGLKRKTRWSLRVPKMSQGLWELLQLNALDSLLIILP